MFPTALLLAALALPQDGFGGQPPGDPNQPPDAGGGDDGVLPPWDCQENEPDDFEYYWVNVYGRIGKYRTFHHTHVEYLIGACDENGCEYNFPPPKRVYDWAGPARETWLLILTDHPGMDPPGPASGDGKVPMWTASKPRPTVDDGPDYVCRPNPDAGGSTDPNRPGLPPYPEECEKGPLKSATVWQYQQQWFVRGRQSIATGERQICDDCDGLGQGVFALGPKAEFVTDNYGPYLEKKSTRAEACQIISPILASREPDVFPNPVLIAMETFR